MKEYTVIAQGDGKALPASRQGVFRVRSDKTIKMIRYAFTASGFSVLAIEAD